MDKIKHLVKEKLCKKGQAYRKRRMAAGEKSSAYLSGRAVKVCKGQMSGKKKKKKTNEAEEKSNKIDKASLILPRGKKIYLQAEEQDYQRGLIVELTEEGGYKLNYWYGPDAKVYPAEVEVDGESIKEDAREVYIKFHPELEENIDPQSQKKHKGKAAPFGSAYELAEVEWVDESLRDWFKKEDWVRINTSGNITGPCGTMKKGKTTTRCLPRAKAKSLTKAQRKATVAKKVRGGKKGKQFVKNTGKAEYKKK